MEPRALYFENQKTRTRLFIEKAVFECLECSSCNMLSITQVCQMAQISRKTFYRHYGSLEQCIKEWFEKLENEYLSKTDLLEGYAPNRIRQELFSFFAPFRPQLAVLAKAGYPLDELFLQTARRVIDHRAGGQAGESLILFSSGGFLALWKAWILQETDLPAQAARPAK